LRLPHPEESRLAAFRCCSCLRPSIPIDIPQTDNFEGAAYRSGIDDKPPETAPAYGGLESLEVNPARVQEIIDALQVSQAEKKERANAANAKA
jgi:hypothetical protein